VAAQMSGEVRDEQTLLIGFGVGARCVKSRAARWAPISAGTLAEPVRSARTRHQDPDEQAPGGRARPHLRGPAALPRQGTEAFVW
jgi:hypothetical protein